MDIYEKAKKRVDKKRRSDPVYDLKYRLFFAMRSQLEIMAEHNDSELSLYKEIQAADAETLQYYKEMYL